VTFNDFVNALTSGFAQFSFGDVVDIIIIAVLLYFLIMWAKRTRAYQLLKGLAVLLVCYIASQLLSLYTLSWLLDKIVESGFVLIVILFQPELRNALERIGRNKLISSKTHLTHVRTETEVTVNELQKAVLNLARRRVGALIVIAQKTALGDIISTGTRLDANISCALIENIFEPNTPLHDGAVVISDGVVTAAACILPLSDDMGIARELGTRHRAALGISGVSDSVTIVVSEETGVISMARDGQLLRYIDAKALKDILESIFLAADRDTLLPSWRHKRREKHGDE